MPRKPFTTSIDPEIIKQIRIQAAIEERGINDIVEELLIEYLASHKKKDAH